MEKESDWEMKYKLELTTELADLRRLLVELRKAEASAIRTRHKAENRISWLEWGLNRQTVGKTK